MAKSISAIAADLSAVQKTQASFQKLSTSAAELNAASDELTEVVSALDRALKALNLGVSGWVVVTHGGDDSNGYHWSRNLGYSRVGKKWGIALSEESGNVQAPDDDKVEVWLFSEAPRWLRIEAVAKIPDLLEHLGHQADTTAKRLRKKTEEAKALTDAINEIAAQRSGDGW